MKLKSYVKTTGGKGLHVVVPIRPVAWDIAKKFTHIVALSMAKDEPARYTANPIKSRRRNRVFIDYLRNSREATAIVPYSTRARAGAPVAVPLAWSELSSLRASNQYTVKNLSQRLSKLSGDPWAGMRRRRPGVAEIQVNGRRRSMLIDGEQRIQVSGSAALASPRCRYTVSSSSNCMYTVFPAPGSGAGTT